MNLDKFLGCIFGVAVGDALGMSFEVLSPAEIQNKVGRVDRFYPASINPKIFASERHLPAGAWTDDTQLTLATMEALIESSGRFDMDVIARRHVEAYLGDRRGWGRSTRNACKRLSEGVSWRESGEPGGSGNGVMMKIAPLGLYSSVTPFDRRRLLEFAEMTHREPYAIVAGCVHAWIVEDLARIAYARPLPFPNFSGMVQYYARMFEAELPSHENKISELAFLLYELQESGTLSRESPEELSLRFGGGTKAAFSAYNSFGLSYAMFLRNPNSFDAVYDAIAAGGDTDSNASIVGSLLGALHGEKIIPLDLVREVERSEWIRARTEVFYSICSQKKNNAP